MTEDRVLLKPFQRMPRMDSDFKIESSHKNLTTTTTTSRKKTIFAKYLWFHSSEKPKVFVIHHFSPFRRFWDAGTVLMLMILVILLPLLLAFEFENDGTTAVAWIQTIWFMVDLVLNFITTYPDIEGTAVASYGSIAIEYLRGWFLIDVVSAMPVEELSEFDTIRGSTIARGLKLLKIVKLLRLFKLERNQFVSKIQRRYQLKYSTISLVKFLVLLIVGAHWLGCLFYTVSVTSGCSQPYCSWVVNWAQDKHYNSPIDEQCFSDEPCNYWPLGSRYLVSLYWAMTTMSTIGYGDISPRSEAEQSFALFGMLCGSLAFAYGLTNLCTILFYYKQYEVRYQSQVDLLFEFFERRKVPLDLRLKIQEYLSYKYHSEICEFGGEKSVQDVMYPLSDALREDLRSAWTNKAFPRRDKRHKHLLFNVLGESSRFKGQYTGKLVCHAFAAGDVIQSSIPSLNPIGESIAYVAEGCVSWRSRKESHILQAGSSFGEINALLSGDNYYPQEGFSFVAQTNCVLFLIKGKEAMDVLRDWPIVGKPFMGFLQRRMNDGGMDFFEDDDEEMDFFTKKTQAAFIKEKKRMKKRQKIERKAVVIDVVHPTEVKGSGDGAEITTGNVGLIGDDEMHGRGSVTHEQHHPAGNGCIELVEVKPQAKRISSTGFTDISGNTSQTPMIGPQTGNTELPSSNGERKKGKELKVEIDISANKYHDPRHALNKLDGFDNKNDADEDDKNNDYNNDDAGKEPSVSAVTVLRHRPSDSAATVHRHGPSVSEAQKGPDAAVSDPEKRRANRSFSGRLLRL